MSSSTWHWLVELPDNKKQICQTEVICKLPLLLIFALIWSYPLLQHESCLAVTLSRAVLNQALGFEGVITRGRNKVIDYKMKPKNSQGNKEYERVVMSESWGEECGKREDIFGETFLLEELQGQLKAHSRTLGKFH